MPAGSTENNAMKLEDVRVFFERKKFLEKKTVIKAVDGITLDVGRGEVVGIVGESGSGKTTLGRAALGLIRPTSGRVLLLDENKTLDVGKAKGKDWKRLRKKLQMVYQDPFSSIDPNMKAYDALRIPLQAQGVKKRDEIEKKILDVINRVGLPREILNNYLFQLSGGQRQRVGIARVLLFDPALVVADEPVSMLDASLKGDILGIIEKESTNRKTAFLFVTHDMSVARVVSDRIAVMYLGKLAELASSDVLVENPLHPYTQALMQASPTIDVSLKSKTKKVNILGELAISTEHPPGCKFHPRCPYVMDACKVKEPPLKEVEPGHWVSCWLH